MKVISWNIAFGVEVEQATADLSTIAELADADVILLQEMDEEGTERIAESLGANYYYASAAPHGRSGRDFGNAILAPWHLSQCAEVPLPGTAAVSGQARSATRATVEIGSTRVVAYSVHTEIAAMSLARRSEQFRTVARDGQAFSNDHVIVGGDFNTVTPRGVRALETAMGTADLVHASAGAGASFKRVGRKIPLDHIFTRGFDVVSSGVAWSATASDHMPLWVELTSGST